MAKIKYILVLCLLLASQARADEWTEADTAWEGVYLLLHYVDWQQTRYCADHPIEVTLKNAIGEHPTRASVDRYFLIAGIGHGLISYALPKKWEIFGLKVNPRFTWQITTSIDKANAVYKNYEVRIKYNF